MKLTSCIILILTILVTGECSMLHRYIVCGLVRYIRAYCKKHFLKIKMEKYRFLLFILYFALLCILFISFKRNNVPRLR